MIKRLKGHILKISISLFLLFCVILLVFSNLYYDKISISEDLVIEVENSLDDSRLEIFGLTVFNKKIELNKTDGCWRSSATYFRGIYILSSVEIDTLITHFIINKNRVSVTNEAINHESGSFLYKLQYKTSSSIHQKIGYIIFSNFKNSLLDKISFYYIGLFILIVFVLLPIVYYLIKLNKSFKNNVVLAKFSKWFRTYSFSLKIAVILLFLVICMIWLNDIHKMTAYLNKIPAWLTLAISFSLPVLYSMILARNKKLDRTNKLALFIFGTTIVTLISISLAILVLLSNSISDSIVSQSLLIFAIVLLDITFGFLLFAKFFKKKINILMTISSLTYSYLFCEAVYVILILFNVVNSPLPGDTVIYNKSPLYVNHISGFKYFPGEIRCARVLNGKLLFDNTFSVNNKGYVSDIDFEFQKDPKTYRFIVLGDSFTAGEYIQMAWPSRLNTYDFGDSVRYEFYSFALGGSGFAKWCNQFLYEIIPDYEFDAVIIASFGDDFKRDMLYGDCKNGKVMYYKSNTLLDSVSLNADKINWVEAAQYNCNSDLLIRNSLPIGLPLQNVIYEFLNQFEISKKNLEYYQLISTKKDVNSVSYCGNDFINRYGQQKFDYLSEVLTYCLQNKKPVVIASVPSLELIELSRHEEFVLNKELEFIADTFNLQFFNSYPYFSKLEQDKLESMFIKNDSHWNQRGSDYFADALYVFLKDSVLLTVE